jgi:hypothetical protein
VRNEKQRLKVRKFITRMERTVDMLCCKKFKWLAASSWYNKLITPLMFLNCINLHSKELAILVKQG